MAAATRDQLFLSYSHADEKWLRQLCKSLKHYLNDSRLTLWMDRKIKPGQDWEKEIEQTISSTAIAVLLVTPDFLNSEYIMTKELPLLMKAQDEGLLTITWIAIHHSAVAKTEVAKLQYLNVSPKPLATLGPNARNEELIKICEKIEQMLNDPPNKPQPNPTTLADDNNVERVPSVFGPRFPCPDPFRDRKEEIEDLQKYVEDPAARFICIVGPDGAGKTALLSKFCDHVESGHIRFVPRNEGMGADGIVYFTFRKNEQQAADRLFEDIQRLLPAPDAKDVLAYWKDGNRDVKDKFGYLLSKIPGERCLLALDNVDEILNSENRIADSRLESFFEVFLTTKHALRVIGTTREPVAVGIGSSLSVRKLPLHQGLPREEAQQMLVDLFRSLDPRGTLGMLNTPAATVAAAVDRCNCLPSALQMVAAILNESVISLGELLDDQALFNEQVVKNLTRQQLSFQSKERILVLQALSVFSKPVPASAVDFVLQPYCEREKLRINVSQCLNALRQSYLVAFSPVTKTFDLDPTKRMCAYELISENDRGDDIHDWETSAADYYRSLRKPESQWQCLDDVQPHLDEFEHRMRAEDFEAAAAIVDEIDRNHLFHWGHYDRLVAMRERLNGRLANQANAVRNLLRLCHVSRLTGRRAESVSIGREAVSKARSLNDEAQLIECIGQLADALADAGHFPEAVAAYEEAVGLAHARQDAKAEAWNLGGLAILFRQSGKVDEALNCYERGIQVAEAQNDPIMRNRFVCNRAWAHLAHGRVDDSLRDSEASLAFARSDRLPQYEAFSLHHLGRAYIQLADFEKVRDYNLAALDICITTTHEQRCEALVRRDLGYAYQQLGQLDEAELQFKKSYEYYETESHYICAARLGILDLQQGNREGARQQFLTAIDLCKKILRTKEDYYEALYQLALAYLALGDTAECVPAYERAIRVSGHCGTLREAWLDLELLERAAPSTVGVPEIKTLIANAAASCNCEFIRKGR